MLTLVGDVIGIAREPVECLHPGALGGRNQP